MTTDKQALLELADKWISIADVDESFGHIKQATTRRNDAYELRDIANTLAAREDGFVLVPVEPTEEMLGVAYDVVCDWTDMESYRTLYKSMLAAAPKPQDAPLKREAE